MRVAFVNGLFPQLSQTFVIDQIAYAIDHGHEVAVLATRKAPNFFHAKLQKHQLYGRIHSEKLPKGERLANLGAGVIRHPRSFARSVVSRLRGKGKIPLGAFALASQLGATPDVLLANFGTNLPLAVRLKRHIYRDAHVACIFHGFDLSKYTLEHGWDMYERVAPYVDLALTVNSLQAAELRARNLFRRVEVLHLGIDLHRLPTHEPHGDAAFSLLFVGRLVEKKGLEYLLGAVAELRDLPIRLHVVGDGPLLREAQIHARVREIDDRVVFYGAKNHDFVKQLMASCDCLVAPSVTALDGDSEGIPVTLMEAMAIGIPVISTFHSGIPELITNGLEGRLVAERDVPALAQAIHEEYRERGRFVAGAREKVRRDFAMNTQYGKLFDTLETLVREEAL